jgi:hypothetical protein
VFGEKMFVLSPFFTALTIPVVFIFLGAIAKKLVRAKPWERRDFYLGIELMLTAMSSGFIRLFELGQNWTPTSQIDVISTTSFLFAAFALFFVVIVLHQMLESRGIKRRTQIIWLCIISNLIGGGLLATFILLRGTQ